MGKDAKRRAWGFLLYPADDGELAQMVDAIEKSGQMCVLSPVHDRDTWTEADEQADATHKAGELKKRHVHGMWVFNGGARMSQALKACEIFGESCPKHVEPINSVVGMTRYFAHMDNPEKFQYNPTDIRAYNGAEIRLLQRGSEMADGIGRECLEWLQVNHVVEYAALVDFARDERPDWLPYVTRRAVFFGHYLQSVRRCMGVR